MVSATSLRSKDCLPFQPHGTGIPVTSDELLALLTYGQSTDVGIADHCEGTLEQWQRDGSGKGHKAERREWGIVHIFSLYISIYK